MPMGTPINLNPSVQSSFGDQRLTIQKKKDQPGFKLRLDLNSDGEISPDELFKFASGGAKAAPGVGESFGDAFVQAQTPALSTNSFNPANFAVQSPLLKEQALRLAGGLGYNADAQIADAERGIDLEFDQAKEALARTFALDPGGTKSGTAQNRLEPLEVQRALAKARVRQDIRNRAGEEQRANIGTLSNLSTAQGNLALAERGQAFSEEAFRQQMGLSTAEFEQARNEFATRTGMDLLQFLQAQEEFGAQFGLAERQQGERERAAKAQEGLQAGALVGSLDGQATIAQQAQREAERAQRAQENIQTGALVGSLDGRTTVEQQAQREAERARREEERLRQGQLLGFLDTGGGTRDTLQAIQTFGQVYNQGTFAGQKTASEVEAEYRRGATDTQLALQREQQADDRRFREGELTGVLPGKSIGVKAFIETFGINPDAPFEQIRDFAEARGYTFDPNAFVFRNDGRDTLALRTLTFSEAAEKARLTGDFVNPETGESLDTLEKTQQAFNNAIQRAAQVGTFLEPGAEESTALDTLAARALTLQAEEATGEVTVDGRKKKTVAQKSIDLQKDIEEGKLFLQQQAQAYGQAVTEAELTGNYDKMGTEFGAFQASLNSKQGDVKYNPRYDLNGDGTIDFADYEEFKKVAEDEPVKTLQAQALQEQKVIREFNEKVAKAGLLGTYESQTIVDEKQRLFENKLQEAQLFVDAPPMTLTLEDFQKLDGVKEGEARYRPSMDIDGNGVINQNDMFSLQNSNRIDIVSGSWDRVDEMVLTYQPEGRTTMLAASLGLEEEKMRETARQFSTQMNQAVTEFKANFTGLLTDEKGFVYTGLDKQRFTEAQSQFDERMSALKDQFQKQMGLDIAKMNQAEWAAWLGLLGAIAQNAGTVISSDKPTQRTGNLSSGFESSRLEFSFGTGTPGRTSYK